MKKIILFILSISLLCLFSIGCAGSKPAVSSEDLDPALLGTWEEDYFHSGYIFNDNGTGEDTFWDLPFTYKAKDDSIRIIYDDEMWVTANYSYSVDGSSLFMQQNGSEDTYEYIKK